MRSLPIHYCSCIHRVLRKLNASCRKNLFDWGEGGASLHHPLRSNPCLPSYMWIRLSKHQSHCGILHVRPLYMVLHPGFVELFPQSARLGALQSIWQVYPQRNMFVCENGLPTDFAEGQACYPTPTRQCCIFPLPVCFLCVFECIIDGMCICFSNFVPA